MAENVNNTDYMEKGFNFEDDPFSSNQEEYAALFDKINDAPKDLYDKYEEMFYNVYPKGLCPQELMDKVSDKKFDIHYADKSEDQKFDIYYPETGEGPFPVIINLHAGGFCGGSAKDFTLPPMFQLLEKGYAMVSLDYRLSAEVHWPACVYDAKAAVRYMRAHAKELNIDPNKIISWGYSAGAYLSAMLAVTGDEEMFNDCTLGNMDQSSRVQAAIVGSGPCGNMGKFDAYLDKLAERTGVPVLFPHNDPNSVESWLFGLPLPKIPDLLRLADPKHYVNKDTAPILLFHGTDDPLVPFEIAEAFHEKLVNTIGKENTEFIVGQGNHHCDDPWFMTPERFQIAFDFIEKHVK